LLAGFSCLFGRLSSVSSGYLLLLLITVASTDPASARGLVVEVKTTVSPHAAVGGSQACKRRLGRPGERTLLRSEAGQELDDFIHCKYFVIMIVVHRETKTSCYLEDGASLTRGQEAGRER
jgi:hypothetical protein